MNITGIPEYHAFAAADAAWQAELERLFGKNAGDIRYTLEGRSGPTLFQLYAEVRRTNDAWQAVINPIQHAKIIAALEAHQ